MIEILKNMWRRKGRTLLTITGIAIGILALVVMGGIAEKLTLLVDGGVKYYADKVQVSSAETNLFGNSPMQLSKKSEIEAVPGVRCVAATISTTIDTELDTVNFGPPPFINSRQQDCDQYESFDLSFSEGSDFAADARGKVILGSDLVKKYDASIGSEIELRGKKFEVVGILEKTFTTPDTSAVIPFADAQEIMYEDLPTIVKGSVKAAEITSGFVAYPEEGVDPNLLADDIKNQVSDVSTVGPKTFEDSIASTVQTFNSIIFGIAIISLLVGTLSIVNTMTMSISERTKEIGIKKALGAKNRNILLEYLAEAGVIGFFGGIIGIGLGYIIVTAINSYMETVGDKIFLLTPRLLIGSLAFSVAVGVVAGIYPAYYAVKISIVKSLREE